MNSIDDLCLENSWRKPFGESSRISETSAMFYFLANAEARGGTSNSETKDEKIQASYERLSAVLLYCRLKTAGKERR